MVWTDHEDDGLDPTDRGLHAGNILYWLATIVAGLIVIFVIADLRSVGRKASQSCGYSPCSPRCSCGLWAAFAA